MKLVKGSLSILFFISILNAQENLKIAYNVAYDMEADNYEVFVID